MQNMFKPKSKQSQQHEKAKNAESLHGAWLDVGDFVAVQAQVC